MKKILSIMCFVLLFFVPISGWTVPLQDLFNGQSLLVGDKLFFNWNLIDLVVTNPIYEPNFANIEVLPLNDQALNPGIKFEANGQLTVADQNFLYLKFGFYVATLDSMLPIKGNSLKIVDFSFSGSGGVIAITEDVFKTSGLLLASKLVEADQRYGIFSSCIYRMDR